MAWYNEKGPENDVVVSSRIRFARNIADYPFESNSDDTSAKEIIEKVEKALGNGYSMIDFQSITPNKAMAYSEKHFVSPEFANKTTPHALFENKDNSVEIMVCEEDHLRIQSITAGLSLKKAFEKCSEAEEKSDENLNIAFDESLGYLTHCPTNLGTAMRASVMLFLPALTAKRAMEGLSNQLSKIGIVIRGMYGENSSPDACMYQISNRVTMGVTEEAIIKKLEEITLQICESERKARESIKSDSYMRICDRVSRSYGIMKYARMMSSSEFMKLFSDVRLGISLGIIENVSYEDLGKILIGILPANLIENNGGKTLSDTERDIKRAEFVKVSLN